VSGPEIVAACAGPAERLLFVLGDRTTTTQGDIDDGQLIRDIGVAPP